MADSAYFEGDDGTSHARMPTISALLGPPVTCATCATAIATVIERGSTRGCSNPQLAANLACQALLPGVYALLTASSSSGRYVKQAHPDQLP